MVVVVVVVRHTGLGSDQSMARCSPATGGGSLRQLEPGAFCAVLGDGV